MHARHRFRGKKDQIQLPATGLSEPAPRFTKAVAAFTGLIFPAGVPWTGKILESGKRRSGENDGFQLHAPVTGTSPVVPHATTVRSVPFFSMNRLIEGR